MTGWAATKGTPTPIEVEVAWWRAFATKISNCPPPGSPLTGFRYRLIDVDSREPAPFGAHDPSRSSMSATDRAARARLLGAGP